MKILQINSVYGYGSTGKIVKEIHDYLLTQGQESHVFYSRELGNKVNDKNVEQFYDSTGFHRHVLEGVFWDKHGLYSKHNTEKMIKRIQTLHPDVIHLHNIHGFYCNYPMLFAYLREYGCPVVWTLHDCWSYTGFCAYYDYHDCHRWQKGCTSCPYKDTYPYRVLSQSSTNYETKRKAYEGVDLHLVTPSTWLQMELSKSILKDKPCSVIPNTVNLSSFYPEDSPILKGHHLEDKRVYLGVANVWSKPKGLEEYYRFQRHLRDDECLVLVGLSKKQMNHLPKGILGFGRLPLEQLRKWYSAATYFVNLTLEDNYPTVDLEANACGTAVVGYNTGGVKETVEDPALIVERYDIEGVLEQVRKEPRRGIQPTKPKHEMAKMYGDFYQTLEKK